MSHSLLKQQAGAASGYGVPGMPGAGVQLPASLAGVVPGAH